MVDTRKMIAFAGSVAMLAGVAACGNSNSAGGGDQTSGDAQQEITVWAWEPTLKDVAKKFEAKYPNIKVNLQNVGTNIDEYTQLTNALEAGNGAPDVAQIEYYALPEYAIKKQLKELSGFGAKDYADYYTPGTWAQVQFAGGIYGLPMDSGPMAFFYNKEVFDKAGVDATQIKTWDDYYEAAKKIRALGDKYYITNDAGDAGMYEAMTWLAGGQPFSTSDDGTTITVNLTGDKGSTAFQAFWQKMISEGLIDTKTAGWTDDWNRGLSDGTIASLFSGAWMPANLVGGAPTAAGKWRVAPMPTPDGETANAELGGSSLAVIEGGEKTEAAWKFIDFANHDREGVTTRVDGGAFPADNETMKDSAWLGQTTIKKDGEDVDYFSGQKYNEVLAEGAKNVLTGYQVSPYGVAERAAYLDTVGGAFTGQETMQQGVQKWQDKIIQIGKDQGFTVKQ
ncbi:ABC transporter substrate-binding protein [Bifidobacterium myosotis]|uniref:ABC transporter substrate-binding protein n=1 Tax=Bifidobacterium myosotis TaxID=1630166 RepID=A0A261FD73_9BIFI|nr:sugar ABC transporter substrate-binding protein [Bifidobacterium myosotis]OZG57087.1 ABC transporter substrate-binding protein [Bifidobacterium myosotis]